MFYTFALRHTIALLVFIIFFFDGVLAQNPYIHNHNGVSNNIKHKLSASFRIIKSEPIRSHVSELVEYIHCHESPLKGHYRNSTASTVGTVTGAVIGHEYSGGSFKPLGTLLGAVLGKKIGDSIAPPQKVREGDYTHCGKSYKNVVVQKIIGYRHFYKKPNGELKVIEEYIR